MNPIMKRAALNPARFTLNYNIAANSIRPGPKAIRAGSVGTLYQKAKKALQPVATPKFTGKPLPL